MRNANGESGWGQRGDPAQVGGSGKTGAGDAIRTRDPLLGKQRTALNSLNRMSVSELAELSGLSKAYISQVRHGIRPPSQRLIEALGSDTSTKRHTDYLSPFIQSRQSRNASPSTIELYRFVLERFLLVNPDVTKTKGRDIERYLVSIPPNGISLGNRHAHFRVIKTFFRWLEREYGIPNPTAGIEGPRLPKLILPSLTRQQVLMLIDKAEGPRNKAIIALATESGLRVSELARIRVSDINWQTGTIRTIGKGRKEALAPFGALSKTYLTEWLNEYQPNGSTIWDINSKGMQMMLKRLKAETGLPCNPHTFRRTFACLLRKAGVDTMTIKDLGRWESLEMVQRYTRSVTFEDSLRFYKAPLG